MAHELSLIFWCGVGLAVLCALLIPMDEPSWVADRLMTYLTSHGLTQVESSTMLLGLAIGLLLGALVCLTNHVIGELRSHVVRKASPRV